MRHVHRKLEIGDRFEKVAGEDKDLHKIGARGDVLRRLGPLPTGEFMGEYGYFVRFDGDPIYPIFIRGKKIMGIK